MELYEKCLYEEFGKQSSQGESVMTSVQWRRGHPGNLPAFTHQNSYCYTFSFSFYLNIYLHQLLFGQKKFGEFFLGTLPDCKGTTKFYPQNFVVNYTVTACDNNTANFKCAYLIHNPLGTNLPNFQAIQ